MEYLAFLVFTLRILNPIGQIENGGGGRGGGQDGGEKINIELNRESSR